MWACSGAERERAYYPALGQEGMTAIGLDPIRFYQIGPWISGIGDILGNDSAARLSCTSAYSHSVIQPFHLPGFLLGDACKCIQAETSGLIIRQEVEECLTVQVFHHPCA